MPAKKPAVEETVKPEPEPRQPERWELEDEFKRLLALGNKNPDRLEELKRLLAS